MAAQCAYGVAHVERHTDRTFCGVRHLYRIVEEDHQPVASEAFQRPLVRLHEASHRGVVVTQHAHHLLGLRGLGERGEAAQILQWCTHGDDKCPEFAPDQQRDRLRHSRMFFQRGRDTIKLDAEALEPMLYYTQTCRG